MNRYTDKLIHHSALFQLRNILKFPNIVVCYKTKESDKER